MKLVPNAAGLIPRTLQYTATIFFDPLFVIVAMPLLAWGFEEERVIVGGKRIDMPNHMLLALAIFNIEVITWSGRKHQKCTKMEELFHETSNALIYSQEIDCLSEWQWGISVGCSLGSKRLDSRLERIGATKRCQFDYSSKPRVRAIISSSNKCSLR